MSREEEPGVGRPSAGAQVLCKAARAGVWHNPTLWAFYLRLVATGKARKLTARHVQGPGRPQRHAQGSPDMTHTTISLASRYGRWQLFPSDLFRPIMAFHPDHRCRLYRRQGRSSFVMLFLRYEPRLWWWARCLPRLGIYRLDRVLHVLQRHTRQAKEFLAPLGQEPATAGLVDADRDLP